MTALPYWRLSSFYLFYFALLGATATQDLRALRAELLALPPVVRCVDDARPYRPYFPYGAPDRD